MAKLNLERLLAKIEIAETQLHEVKKLIEAQQLQQTWFSTTEVAALLGISPKTVANYCQNGTYKRTRKKNGRLQIHKSELNT